MTFSAKVGAPFTLPPPGSDEFDYLVQRSQMILPWRAEPDDLRAATVQALNEFRASPPRAVTMEVNASARVREFANWLVRRQDELLRERGQFLENVG